MGKHSADNRNHHTSVPRRRREISLETILEEYRTMPWEQEAAEAPAEEPARALTGEEEDGVFSAELSSDEYALPEEEDFLPGADAPAEEAFPEESAEEPFSDDIPELTFPEDASEDTFPDEAFADAEPEAEEQTSADEDGIFAENYGDDDSVYAGALPQDEEAEPEAGESGDAAPAEKPVTRRQKRPSLRKRLAALLALSEERQDGRTEPPEPEIEDADKELEPRKAVKFYSAQIPALKLRSIGAIAVTVFVAWITFSCSFGWALPGQLQTNVRLCTFVCMCGELTVMLMGLDLMTSGIMSLLRGRPGAESLLFLAALASLLDGIFIVATGIADFGVPFSAAPCAAIACALRGAMHTCRGYRWSFLALHHAQEPNVLTSETLDGRSGKYLRCSRQTASGFIRRSEEPDFAEALCSAAFLPMAVGSLGLSLVLAVGGGQLKAFFHLFGLLTAVCAAFPWLLALPMFFDRTARYLLKLGTAVSGWAGARDVGSSYRLIIRDEDIFPEGTVELTGTRILDKKSADRIISVTGGMLSACGCALSGVFTEFMLRKNCAMCTVEEFSVGDGGAEGVSEGQRIRIGTLGHMHLNGVKVPDKLKYENAVYTAIDGEMAGLFLFRYHPTGDVRSALLSLRREHRKPVFAVRDFNIDPFLIQKAFDISTEGFEFPPVSERYRISEAPAAGKKPISGILARAGLDTLVDFAENSSRFFQIGMINTLLTLASVVLGVLACLVPGWKGNWEFLSAGRVFLYDLLWLLPSLGSLVLFRK